MEASKSKKVPKVIRYFLIMFIISFFATVILGLFLLGILSCKKNIFGGLFVIAVSMILLISAIIQFRKVYLKKEK